MIFWNKICGLILVLLLSCFFLSAQKTTFPGLNYTTFLLKNKLQTSDTSFHFIPSISLFINPGNLKPPVSANFSTCTYGFFCREEIKIERAAKMPIRIRLG